MNIIYLILNIIYIVTIVSSTTDDGSQKISTTTAYRDVFVGGYFINNLEIISILLILIFNYLNLVYYM